MGKSKPKTLPQFHTSLELVEFFETRDMGEYWDSMPEADFDIEMRKRSDGVILSPSASLRVNSAKDLLLFEVNLPLRQKQILRSDQKRRPSE